MIDEVTGLVAKFRENEIDYRAAGYREHQLRVEFLNPLFTCLGWDVNNKGGRPVALKDVVHEDTVRIDGSAKAPDYGFRVEGIRRFFVEAKSPAVGVADSSASLQLRSYGWNAKLPISVLTDFETLAVYDCRVPPKEGDANQRALLISYKCDEFVSRWDEISALLSRAAVAGGSLDQFALEKGGAQGVVPVDQEFLAQIENWRTWLAKDISTRNPKIDLAALNSSVQLIIDRIIFLRIAEDRGIEPYKRLLGLCDRKNVYDNLVSVFRQADTRYNSGLFHFEQVLGQGTAPDEVTPSLKVDDKIIKKLLKGLYRPESLYQFSVMPAEILGQVYEQFLGKVIRLTPAGAVVEHKPEVKKAGGVYYTPTDVVRYMVERSLTPMLTEPPLMAAKKKGQKKPHALRILDPSCGSGSFLIEVYQQLLDWHLDWYISNGAEKFAGGRTPKLFSAGENGWRLSIAEKRRILLSHIFGVDIDTQAVEVTKLSLLLKMLEGESRDALAAQMDLFVTRVLPDLSNNIKCGNSLVGLDIIPDLLHHLTENDEITRNNPFDWKTEFQFLGEDKFFDVIVGNPPYIDSEWMTKHWPSERIYCTANYPYASGNWDIFCVFIGKSIDLLEANGVLSFIVPNKLMTATYATTLRRYMTDTGFIESIRDYSGVSVFPVAVYPVVFSFRKKVGTSKTTYEKVTRRTSTLLETATPIRKLLPKSGEEWAIIYLTKHASTASYFLLKGNNQCSILPTRFTAMPMQPASILKAFTGLMAQSARTAARTNALPA